MSQSTIIFKESEI